MSIVTLSKCVFIVLNYPRPVVIEGLFALRPLLEQILVCIQRRKNGGKKVIKCDFLGHILNPCAGPEYKRFFLKSKHYNKNERQNRKKPPLPEAVAPGLLNY